MEKIQLPSNKNFGIVFFFVFLIISLYPLTRGKEIILGSLIISFLFLILGLLNSKLLTPLNNLWFKFGIYLGKFINPVILGIIFFLLVTPIGLIMKILRKDLLKLKYNNNKTYWIEKKGQKSKMKNQF
tara:strand:+ start:209 stop:592 length:384 start_codon:yes stop_codon:yes gene_type:complete